MWTIASQVSRFESMHLIVMTGIKDKTIFEQTQLLVRTEKKSIQEENANISKLEFFHMMRNNKRPQEKQVVRTL
jgi:hypothetical protein